MDRRKLRTQAALRQAALHIIARQGWGEVNVAAICRHADVARSTYYLHYQTAQEVVWDALQVQMDADGVFSALDARPHLFGGQPLGLPLFAHIERHWSIYQVVLSHPDAATLRHMLSDALAERFWGEVIRPFAPTQADAAYMTTVLTGAFVASAQWWLQTPEPPTARQVSARFAMMLGPGVVNVLNMRQLMADVSI